MKRREFIKGLGVAAAAWPFAAGAQAQMPRIGYLGATSREKEARTMAALREGLAETGLVEGQNVAIEYRWADGQYDRLPALAAELIEKRVDVIFTPSSTPAALAVKKATSTIPIVFTLGSDPVAEGLVDSLARPGGNSTGVTILVSLLSAKRMEQLKALVPKAGTIGVLINPKNAGAWPDLKEARTAAQTLGLQLVIREASSEGEVDAAFAGFDQSRTAALFVIADGFFRNQPDQLTRLAARYSIPVSYPWPEFAKAGGLICYGANAVTSWRLGGVYVGRILKGSRPAELPVVQSTRLELTINGKTAKSLGLEIPAALLAVADEVVD